MAARQDEEEALKVSKKVMRARENEDKEEKVLNRTIRMISSGWE